MTVSAQKWRPSIGMITSAVIVSVLVLPLVGLLFFRLYENQLVRQTESELIGQAAMLAAIYASEIATAPEGAFPEGPTRPARDPAVEVDERYAPILPSLDLASSAILGARPLADVALEPPDTRELAIGAQLADISITAQRTTLAGFRLLDANGTVVGGRAEVGQSLAHVEEVRSAMSGRFRSVMRVRDELTETPPIYSISRGTKIRVFVAFPVYVNDHVRGVIYASRTPDNILRHLYRERGKVIWAVFMVLIAASVIGLVFVRTIARPMRDLASKAEEIAAGRAGAIGPLKRNGTRELASLSQSFMTMAKRLSERSDYLSVFAKHVSHELKSPLTSIKGAAELMCDSEDAMSPAQRDRFLSNLLTDAERISVLLDRMRDMARADNPALGGAVTLGEIMPALRDRFDGLEITADVETAPPLAISAENAQIIFSHLLDNAQRHGAKTVSIQARLHDGRIVIHVGDDGGGVSEGNRARVFDPFFTTRRAEGGTGMGLGIVRALLRAHGGDIELGHSETGAMFVLTAPLAEVLHISS